MMIQVSTGLQSADRGTEGRGALGVALMAFLVTCVFDPADKFLGIKVWIFLLCWLFAAVAMATSTRRATVSAGLLAYTLTFIIVPLLSIAWYTVNDGGEPFEGFSMLKGYVLITLAPLLVLSRVNLLKQLSAVLTMLAIGVIGVFIGLLVEPGLYAPLSIFGEATGIVMLDNRDYGAEVVLLQVYFVTSPMLAISIAYYFDQAMSAPSRKAKVGYFTLMLINILGMLLAGTRNNILISILLPLALWFLHTRHRALGILLSVGAVAGLLMFFFNEISAFFDPTEISNSTKLAMLKDYSIIFSDPITLLFGQGLGAYHFWEDRGSYFYVTELTYLEMIRNFGIFGAAVMAALLVFPFIHAFMLNPRFREKEVVIGYAAYLVMCISNPNLFSSMGILILSVILAKIYLSPSMNKTPRIRGPV